MTQAISMQSNMESLRLKGTHQFDHTIHRNRGSSGGNSISSFKMCVFRENVFT